MGPTEDGNDAGEKLAINEPIMPHIPCSEVFVGPLLASSFVAELACSSNRAHLCAFRFSIIFTF